MPYKKYNSSNNAFAQLNLPLADTDTTCVLKWKYWRFPTSNFIIKITHTAAGIVTARENIYVTTRTGATCTGLVRAYEPVPIDDNATTNIQQALNFSADDIVEVVVSSEFMKDMQEEIDAKLAKSGWLREWFWANKHIVLNRTTGLEESKNVTDSAWVISTDKIRIQKVSWDFEDATMSQLQWAIAWLTSEYILWWSVASNESVYISNLKKYRNATTPLAAIGQTVAKTTFRMFSSWNTEQRFTFYFTKTWTPQDLTFRIETDDWSWNASWTLVNANAVLVTAIASITSNEIYEIVLPASFNLWAAWTPIHFVFWQGSQYVNASDYLSIWIEDEVCIAHDKVTNTWANQSATRTIWSTAGTTTNPVCSQIIDCIADVQLVSLWFSDSISLLEIYNVTDWNTLLYRNPTTRSWYTLPEPVQLKSWKRYNIAYTAVWTVTNVTGYTSQVNSSQIQWVSWWNGWWLVNIVTRTATFTPNAAILSQYISKAIATTAIKAAVYALVPSASSPWSYPSIKKDWYLTGFSSLVKGATYYLSNTGVISTTAWTVSKVIWVAINSTTIRIDSAINIS